MSTSQEIEGLVQTIRTHRATKNDFFRVWRQGQISRTALATLVRNYLEWVRAFPRALAALAARPLDQTALSETARTLLSETGNGKPEKSHSVLLLAFFEHLVDVEAWRSAPLLPSTVALVGKEIELYGEASLPAALGAQLALEWQAYDMLVELYEGARQYRPRWQSERAFHEAAEYFHVHLAEAEKDHQAESLIALKTVLTSEDALSVARCAAIEHLDAIAAFWDGLAAAIVEPPAMPEMSACA
jgi:pyrroloquinoline quinone (PQQ) biosynthesis protein C